MAAKKSWTVCLKLELNGKKAPWGGGVFEKMAKSTKRCLRKIIGQAQFSFDEIHIAIVERLSTLVPSPT